MTIQAAFIDSREPEWVQQLAFGGAQVAVTLLEYGDLLVAADDGTMIAVERKTPSDLLGSIADGRLFAQLAGLVGVSRWAYLMVTGELSRGLDGKVIADGRPTGWGWASVQGALLQAQEMGVFVVYAAGDSDYEPAVLRLAARSHRVDTLIAPVKAPKVLNDGERILTALPGVGLEKVETLIEYTSSPAWAIQFLTCLDVGNTRIPGIGIGTKRAIRKAFGLKDDQELAVICSDSGNPAEEEPQLMSIPAMEGATSGE